MRNGQICRGQSSDAEHAALRRSRAWIQQISVCNSAQCSCANSHSPMLFSLPLRFEHGLNFSRTARALRILPAQWPHKARQGPRRQEKRGASHHTSTMPLVLNESLNTSSSGQCTSCRGISCRVDSTYRGVIASATHDEPLRKLPAKDFHPVQLLVGSSLLPVIS